MERKKPNVPLLFKVWHDDTLSKADIARMVGVNENALHGLAKRYGLPRRAVTRAAHNRRPDPTPEEIYARAAELRKHWPSHRFQQP